MTSGIHRHFTLGRRKEEKRRKEKRRARGHIESAVLQRAERSGSSVRKGCVVCARTSLSDQEQEVVKAEVSGKYPVQAADWSGSGVSGVTFFSCPQRDLSHCLHISHLSESECVRVCERGRVWEGGRERERETVTGRWWWQRRCNSCVSVVGASLSISLALCSHRKFQLCL